MFDCSDVTALLDTDTADPRLDEQVVRCVPGEDGYGAVVLVGVVHDHPASVGRVATLVEALSPDLLALELPPLALPLFRAYARDSHVPPRLGGEMSAALQAAGGARSVGIDAPNRRYLRHLLAGLRGESVTGGVRRAVARDTLGGLAQAVACRLAATLAAVTPVRLRVYSHLEYDCSVLDPPPAQADHERGHLRRRRAFLDAIETPPAIRLVDAAREAGMVDYLDRARETSSVLAVVGAEHLDPLAEGLGVQP